MYLLLSLMLVITRRMFPIPCSVTLWHHNTVHVPSHMAHELHWGTRDRKMKAFWLKMYNSACSGSIPPSLEFCYASPSGGVLYPIAIHFCRGPIEWTLSSTFWMLTPSSFSMPHPHMHIFWISPTSQSLPATAAPLLFSHYRQISHRN